MEGTRGWGLGGVVCEVGGWGWFCGWWPSGVGWYCAIGMGGCWPLVGERIAGWESPPPRSDGEYAWNTGAWYWGLAWAILLSRTGGGDGAVRRWLRLERRGFSCGWIVMR